MKQLETIQDYYGALYFLQENRHKELTIFIVDDNKVYLEVLKEILCEPNFMVLTFKTGEECLDYMFIKPDLVILDYHLDGVNPNAKKGSEISKIIKENYPKTEVIIISSDRKFSLINDLRLNETNKLLFKDEHVVNKLRKTRDNIAETKKEKNFNKLILWSSALMVILFIVFMVIIFFT